MHIGAIPDYSGDKAIRVLQYYVDGSLVALNHGIYHSSTYAAMTDGQWTETLEELKSTMTTLKESVDESIDELTQI